MRRKVVDPDPGVWFEAIESFATDTPKRGTVVTRGKKLLGSDPLVAAHRGMFVVVGEPVPSVDALVAARATAMEPPAKPKPRPFDPTIDRHFVALRNWRGPGIDAYGVPHFRILARGEVLAPNDPIVKALPHLFEEVRP